MNAPNAPSLLQRKRLLRSTPFSTALISFVVEKFEELNMENFHEGGTFHCRDVEEQISVPSRSGELLMKLLGSANVTPNAES